MKRAPTQGTAIAVQAGTWLAVMVLVGLNEEYMFRGYPLQALARGMGVPASRATTAEEFNKQFAAGLAAPGPYLVEAVL